MGSLLVNNLANPSVSTGIIGNEPTMHRPPSLHCPELIGEALFYMSTVKCETLKLSERAFLKSRRFKLEFYDDEGVRHAITIDGQITREKVGKLLDLVEVMAGTPRATASALSVSPRKFDRLASTIITELKGTSFTATEAKKAFESSFSEKIPISTVSTYLSRLADRGILDRAEAGRTVSYKVKVEESKSVLSLRP